MMSHIWDLEPCVESGSLPGGDDSPPARVAALWPGMIP